MLTALHIQSICEHVDGQLGLGRSLESIVAPLVAGGVKTTVAEVKGWHRAWQKKKVGECYEGAAVDLDLLPAPVEEGVTADDADGEDRGAGDGEVSAEAMAAVVRYLGRELVRAVPCWQHARTKVVKPGVEVERVEGPGSRGGIEWKKSAVIFWQGPVGTGQVLEVLPEHRVVQRVKPNPPHYYHPAVRMQQWTLTDIGSAKLAEQLLTAKARHAACPRHLTAARAKYAARVEFLEQRLKQLKANGPRGGVTVVKVLEIVSRIATVMDLYGVGGTAEDGSGGNGAALARATGKTRAQQSWLRGKLQEEDTARTGGRAGFAGLRKGRK